MRPEAVKWCTSLNRLVRLQLENVIIEIKDLHLSVLLVLLCFYQVIPDLNDMVAVVNMSVHEGVLARLESSYEWLIRNETFINNFHLPDVEQFKLPLELHERLVRLF